MMRKYKLKRNNYTLEYWWAWKLHSSPSAKNISTYCGTCIRYPFSCKKWCKQQGCERPQTKTLVTTKNTEKQCKIVVKIPIWAENKSKHIKFSLKAELSHPWKSLRFVFQEWFYFELGNSNTYCIFANVTHTQTV